MDRRELLKVMALTLGASIALPESVFAKLAEPLDPADLKFFTPVQRALVAEIAETIIPRTDTPGALDAGVPALLESIVQDCLEEADQMIIVAGLADIEARSTKESGKAFAALSTEQRIALLTALEKESKKSGTVKDFIRQFKELVKVTFVNSEVAGTQVFDWTLVPGRWEPARDLTPGQKVYVL